MTGTTDNAGVIAPPPLLAAAAVILGLLLEWLFPAYVLVVLLNRPFRIALGVLLMAAGLALVIAATRAFARAGTNPEPWKPTTAIVGNGVYGWMRNPMYVGGTAALVGLAFVLASDWVLVMTVISTLVLHFGVVKREERYLDAKFGDAYRSYRQRVTRYGWPSD
ncbi:MAG TPA: isoprenylcysteine carboxylmethyltransferase family protein [Pseudolabrys sp.]|nr:isoprenylcysteine carboxylmethyltransferase family protein [Pseudolabrys sp.]